MTGAIFLDFVWYLKILIFFIFLLKWYKVLSVEFGISIYLIISCMMIKIDKWNWFWLIVVLVVVSSNIWLLMISLARYNIWFVYSRSIVIFIILLWVVNLITLQITNSFFEGWIGIFRFMFIMSFVISFVHILRSFNIIV